MDISCPEWIFDEKMRKRNDLQVRLTAMLGRMRLEVKSLSSPALKAHLETLRVTWRLYDSVNSFLMEACVTGEEIDSLTRQHLQAATTYQEIKDIIEVQLSYIAKKTPSFSEIKLMHFDGCLVQWPKFQAAFNSRVLDTALDAGQKIDLLLGALEGQALSAVGQAEKRDHEELMRLWGKLEKNYDNKFTQVQTHIKDIMSIPKIKKGDYKAIREMIDKVENHLRLLEKFKSVGDMQSAIWCVMLTEKLDDEIYLDWKSNSKPMMPDLESLFKYLEIRISAMQERSERVTEIRVEPDFTPKIINKNQKSDRFSPYTARSNKEPQNKCEYCAEDAHRFKNCVKFVKATLAERLSFVRDKRLCMLCLGKYHMKAMCISQGQCKNCQSKDHNTLLCGAWGGKKEERSVNQLSDASVEQKITLLGTANVRIKSNDVVHSIIVRSFCDPGSEVNLISENCAQLLGLKRIKTNILLTGATSNPDKSSGTIVARHQVDFSLIHRLDDSIEVPISALVVPRISGIFPRASFRKNIFDLEASDLADPNYFMPGPVDILLSTGTWANILKDRLRRHEFHGGLVAQDTLLGFVIFGETKDYGFNDQCFQVSVDASCANLDRLLLEHWNADEIPEPRKLTPEEKAAEQCFVETYSRDENGRYMVTIPRKVNPPNLGNSERAARACFHSIERKMNSNPRLKQLYKTFFDDYLISGHMVEVPPADAHIDAYYMPHHPINYEPESKGKFRVVFNASGRSSNGVSFNDQQLPGPKLQADLIETFLKFRLKRFGLTADIKQMFRQVKVQPKEYNYQRIFWRNDPKERIKKYCITVVTWGMVSAGFNAVRALRQCALDGKVEFPIGSEICLNDFYFDDMLSGADNERELIEAQNQVASLLSGGGFELCKWASNSTILSGKLAATPSPVPLECGVLGMKWSTGPDLLHLEIANVNKIEGKITKRKVMSATAQLYDPSGLVLPVIVIGKIMQQNIWRQTIGWDDELPPGLINQWLTFYNEICQLSKIKVPRWLGVHSFDQVELHVFSDASEAAMGAVAYVINRSGKHASSNLVTSRSKVAPIKKSTIPRLELNAAVLAAKLASMLARLFKINAQSVYLWTDSTIVAQWVTKNPLNLSPYVANRVIQIQESTTQQQWRHIPGIDNPADLLSRGATATLIKQSKLWWHGPEWLLLPEDKWPKNHTGEQDVEIPEIIEEPPINDKTLHVKSKRRRLVAFITRNSNLNTISILSEERGEESLLNRHSRIEPMLRVTAYVFRFIHRLKNGNSSRTMRTRATKVKGINIKEYRDALKFWIRHTQQLFLSKEIEMCTNGDAVPRSSSIVKLLPFLDESGLLRVTGRIKFANVPFLTQHQLIIPPQSRLAHLLLVQSHMLTLHGGPQLMTAEMRRCWWINRMRQMAKSVVHHCTRCIRHKKNPSQQLMGNLPKDRVVQGEPFTSTGVDFAGPFIIRRKAGRPSKKDAGVKEKAWVVVFVCLATRAVHVDVAFGLSVDEFLATFERFIMRKGRCFKLWSDNGTNFKGTNNELSKVLKKWANDFPSERLLKYNTEWEFITPSSPHKGGIWEAAVKSVKHHLVRLVGAQELSKIDLIQITTQIEGCLNSRPLWPLSDDPTDLSPVTPAHLLIGKPIFPQALAEYVADTPDNRLTGWQQRQKFLQILWQRWRDDHLTSMQARQKWYKIEKNIKVNDMVIVKNENRPPAQWCIGRVVKTYPGNDGLVRTVTVRTATTQLERPIHKLCILLPPDSVVDPKTSLGGGGPHQMDTV